jgi:hypothetical protein
MSDQAGFVPDMTQEEESITMQSTPDF